MLEHMYYTYIVASRSHNFYVGMTSEIEIRVRQHKEGRFEGYSKKYNCNRLVWFERHPFVQDAIARENPTWLDLSEEWGKPMKMFGEL
jgi:putative endonuclease